MKNNKSLNHKLLGINLIWWILGLMFAFPFMFLLDYFTGRALYYPGMNDMGYAQIQLLRLELILLVLLGMITPVAISAIEVFQTDLIQNDDKIETKKPYFRFYFNLARLKQPVPHLLTVVLIVAEVSFIISMMIYLKQYYDRALIESMDFLISAPFIIILIAYLLLMIDCFLIFCLLLFSFFWGYTWVQWVSDKVFPGYINNSNYSRTLFAVSFIFRALNMFGLIFVINLMVTFSGRFYSIVKMIFGISILLFLWVGIYIVPYLRERVTSKTEITA